MAEHRRLVAATGADFQHPVAFFQLQQLGHQGDDVGLGDGLAFADGEGEIAVGLGAEGFFDEEMAGHRAHRRQHRRIADPSRNQLLFHHPFAGLFAPVSHYWCSGPAD